MGKATYLRCLAAAFAVFQLPLLFASESTLASQSTLDEYDFLNSMVIEDEFTYLGEDWLFSFEQNNTGNIDDPNRQLLSISKFQLFSVDDNLIIDYETDSLENYHSVNWVYDSASFGADWAWSVAYPVEYSLQWEGVYSLNKFDDTSSATVVDDVSWGSGIYGYAQISDNNVNDNKVPGQVFWLVQWGFGVRGQVIDIGVDQFFEEGSRSQFLLPGFKLQWVVRSYSSESNGRLLYEWNMPSAANTEKLQLSGALCANFFIPEVNNCQQRLDSVVWVDSGVDFKVLVMDYQYTLGLGKGSYKQSQHRVRFSARGQYGFEDRLIPRFQYSVGGLYSVRGYEEQLLAGDNALEVTAEYRWLLNLQTTEVVGWLSFFYDWGWWETNSVTLTASPVDLAVERQVKRQGDDGIVRSFGVGVELSYRRFAHGYLAWGRALEDDGVEVEAGESRLHGYIRFDF